MKKLLLGLFFGIVSLFAVAQKPYVSKTFRGGQYNSLEITSAGGKITVKGTSNPEITVDVFVSGNNYTQPLSTSEINRRMENYTLEIRQLGSEIICAAKRVKDLQNWKEGLNFVFEVKTPYRVNTRLKTSAGAIFVQDLEGKTDIQSSGGSLTLRGIKGQTRGITSGGAIYAEGLRDQIDLSTSGGSIQATHISGQTKLQTSGGSINLSDIQGDLVAITAGGSIRAKETNGQIDLKTSGGAIILDDIQGAVKAQTSAGSITADLVKINGPVHLATSAGGVTVTLPKQTGMDLDVSGMKIQANLEGDFEGKKANNHLIGKVRGGGQPVKISTAAGSVRLL